MAAKRPAKKADAAKRAKGARRKRIEVKDLDTKKNPKGGGADPDGVNLQ